MGQFRSGADESKQNRYSIRQKVLLFLIHIHTSDSHFTYFVNLISSITKTLQRAPHFEGIILD